MTSFLRRIRAAFTPPAADTVFDRLARRMQKLAAHDAERHKQLRHQLRVIEEQQTTQLRALRQQLGRVEAALDAASKREHESGRDMAAMREDLLVLRAQGRALLRDRFLAGASSDPALRALERRFSYTSQHDEDGIVYSLLQTVGMPTRRLVDIGCGDFGGNSAWLLLECGFEGLLLDASPIAVSLARRMFSDTRVKVRQAMVTSSNVNRLLSENDVAEDIDLVSIDVDGVDYWIWSALGRRPRLVVIEYNSSFGPDASVTIPDDEQFSRPRDPSTHLYFGASLSALVGLGRQKGYQLALTDPSGTNAFFVRSDLAGGFAPADLHSSFRMYHGHRSALEKLGTSNLAAHFRARGLPLVEVT